MKLSSCKIRDFYLTMVTLCVCGSVMTGLQASEETLAEKRNKILRIHQEEVEACHREKAELEARGVETRDLQVPVRGQTTAPYEGLTPDGAGRCYQGVRRYGSFDEPSDHARRIAEGDAAAARIRMQLAASEEAMSQQPNKENCSECCEKTKKCCSERTAPRF